MRPKKCTLAGEEPGSTLTLEKLATYLKIPKSTLHTLIPEGCAYGNYVGNRRKAEKR